MDQSVQRKIVAGAVTAIAVVGAGAVASAAVGTGVFGGSDSGNDSARDLAESGTIPTAPGSLPDGTNIGDDRTESRQFVTIADGATQTFAAGEAGFVTVSRSGGIVKVVAVIPGSGWTFEIEPGEQPGEAEVDFRNGSARVQFNAELEDGAVRIRVRTRELVGLPDATIPSVPPSAAPRVDNSGPGGTNSGPGSTSSGPGSTGGGSDDGPNHDVGDDHGGSGSGGGSGHGGSSGPG